MIAKTHAKTGEIGMTTVRSVPRCALAAAALLLLGSACASDEPGEDVAADVPAAQIPPITPLPEIDCPPVSEVPTDTVDPRVAAYDEAALDGFVTQRERYDLCPVSADHLFDDPGTVQLYEQHGVVILPQEEEAWVALEKRTRESSDAVESIRGEPGFLLARSDPRSGTHTVFATAEGRRSFEPLLAGQDIASVIFETVRNDLAAMEAAERSIVAALPARLQQALQNTKIEPDRVVILLDEDDPLVDQFTDEVERGEARARAGSASVDVEVRLEPPSRDSTDLCPDRTQCAPIGGGLALEIPTCSTGPPVVDPAGRRSLSTAGHCLDNIALPEIESNRRDSSNSPTGSPVLRFTRSTFDFVDGGDRDFAAAFNNSNRDYVQNVYRRDNIQPLQEVRGSKTVDTGDSVCISARNTPERRCGTVDDTNYEANYDDDGVSLSNLVRVDMDPGRFTDDGDSGGTWSMEVSDTFVVGIHSGRNGDGDKAYFSQTLPTGWSYFTGDSAEFGGAQVRNAVVTFYDSGLLRAPDFGGLDYWSNRVGDAPNCIPELRVVNRNFLALAEFRNDRPLSNSANVDKRIRRLYWTALNRNPSEADIEYWYVQYLLYRDDGFGPEVSWNAVTRRVTGTSEATTRYSKACQLQ